MKHIQPVISRSRGRRGLPGFLLLIFLLLAFSACEENVHWPLDHIQSNTVVVNARITNEFKIQQLELSYPFADLNDTPLPFSGATVVVSWGDQTVYFAESGQLPGTYLSTEPFAVAVDIDYTLTIEQEQQLYEAQSYMVPVLPYDPPEFVFHPTRGLFSIKWNNGKYSPFEQAMYQADIHWSHLPHYDHPDSLSRARLVSYTLNTIDVSYIIFPQDEEEVFFPAGSVVYFSKYSLNDEYASYLRALLSETQWQGSLFETARGNLPGNISNGGLGFFSTCAVIRDTLAVE